MILRSSVILMLLISLAHGQDFVQDMKDIQQKITDGLLDEALSAKKPLSIEEVDVDLGSLIPEVDLHCDEEIPQKSKYKLLMIVEDPKDEALHAVLVGRGDSPSTDPRYIVNFRTEAIDNVIHYKKDGLEVSYATGMQTNDFAQVQSTNSVNWIKKLNVDLNLGKGFDVEGNMLMQQSLSPQKVENGNILKLYDTNQLNLMLGLEAKITDKVSLRSSGEYEDQATTGAKNVGVVSGIEIKTNEANLFVFSSYRKDVAHNKDSGYAGVSWQTRKGFQVRGIFRSIENSVTSVETGVVIPMNLKN